jgi:hypothetical protein
MGEVHSANSCMSGGGGRSTAVHLQVRTIRKCTSSVAEGYLWGGAEAYFRGFRIAEGDSVVLRVYIYSEKAPWPAGGILEALENARPWTRSANLLTENAAFTTLQK